MLAEGLVALWGCRSGLVSDCLLEPQWEVQLELGLDGQLLEDLMEDLMEDLLEDLLAMSMGRWSGSMLAEGLGVLLDHVTG